MINKVKKVKQALMGHSMKNMRKNNPMETLKLKKSVRSWKKKKKQHLKSGMMVLKTKN